MSNSSDSSRSEQYAKWQPWITFAFRWIVAAVFIFASYRKLGNPGENANAVNVYKVLPHVVGKYFGYSLPWLELGIGLLLATGIVPKLTAKLSAAFYLLFIVAIAQAWARKLPINCGCFGNGGVTADGKVHPWAYLTELLRDSGLLILSAYIIRNPFGYFGLDKKD
jgi:uncharacterized membrane protein YphA (DoxX/SURF4 family)